MTKIEDIINSYDILDFADTNQEYLKGQVIKAMIEFGEYCFNAAKKSNYSNDEEHVQAIMNNIFYQGEVVPYLKYETYDDLLNQIKNVE